MSYKGGFTYLNPVYKNKPIGKGQVYDVNSMYPWAMKFCKLPYGEPVYFTGQYEEDEGYPLYVQSLVCDFKLKPGCVPSIQIKNNFHYSETEYLRESEVETVLTLTSVDLKLFFDNYDVTVYSWEGGYKFKGMVGMFADYIDYWYEQKNEGKRTGNKGLTQIAKLMLNSLYGKFGASLTGRSKIPQFDRDQDKVTYYYGAEESRTAYYVPVAFFITSYARDKIIRAAQQLGERFIYADTDSLHVKGTEPADIDIDEYRLGAFKIEEEFDHAIFIRQKTYMESINGKNDVKCAGMPKNIKETVTFENFKEGATFEEVANRIEIYKKCGKEVVSTPVQGLRFNNFLLYVANDSYFGRTVQSLQAKHSVNANDKKLKELGLYKPVAKWQWEDKKLIMERLKPYFEEVLAPKTDEDRERMGIFAQMMERARKRWKEEERALKEAEEAKVPPAILAQRKADLEHALRAFEEAKEKFDCEFNVKKKQAKNKKAKSKEAAAKAPSEEASAETTNTEEPAKEMSNTNLIVVQKSKEPSVPTIQTSHAIKASCKLVFNALCHDTSRFFRGVGECFSVHSGLAKRGYRLVKIDSEESSPSNAQKKPEVKQITCESKKAAANEENSSVIVNPAPEASVTEVQTPTVQDTQAETAALEPFAEKSSEESKTAASENITPVPTEQVDQATTEESAKISREVANPELQQQLVQRVNESVEKSSIHLEKPCRYGNGC